MCLEFLRENGETFHHMTTEAVGAEPGKAELEESSSQGLINKCVPARVNQAFVAHLNFKNLK